MKTKSKHVRQDEERNSEHARHEEHETQTKHRGMTEQATYLKTTGY